MPKFILLAFVALLVCCAAGRADNVDGQVVTELIALAKKKEAPFIVRISALDTLKKLGAKAEIVVDQIKTLLEERVAKKDEPGLKAEERDFFVLHVVQALEGIGYGARSAIPNLVRAKGYNSFTDRAIDTAVQSILNATAPATPSPAPTTKKTVADLQKDLKDTDANVRLVAAKVLGERAKEAAGALPDLVNRMSDDNAEVRRVAAESAQKVVAIKKEAPKEYLSALTKLLKEDKDARVRLVAAQGLGAAGKLAADAKTDLDNAAQKDADEDVKCAAKNAAEKVKKAGS